MSFLEQEGNNRVKLRIRSDEEMTRIINALQYKDQVVITSLMEEFYEPILDQQKAEALTSMRLAQDVIHNLEDRLRDFEDGRIYVGEITLNGNVVHLYRYGNNE